MFSSLLHSGLCVNLCLLYQPRWGNLWKVYVPLFLTVSLPLIRYLLVSMTVNTAFLGTWHPVRSTAVHNPVVVTSESPYSVIIILAGLSLWSPKIDLWMHRSMMMHAAPVSTLQSNLWICALECLICGSVPWNVLPTTVVWCVCCPPAYWGCSSAMSSCGGTSLPTVLSVKMGCVVSYVAVVVMSLLLPVPLTHGLSLPSAFLLCLLFYPLPSLLSLTCNYPWSVPPSHTCSTLSLVWHSFFGYEGVAPQQ